MTLSAGIPLGLILGAACGVFFGEPMARLQVVAMPPAGPGWQAASPFSTTPIGPRKAFDFVSLYIPANPFRSTADNAVPAVVLFSIAASAAGTRTIADFGRLQVYLLAFVAIALVRDPGRPSLGPLNAASD